MKKLLILAAALMAPVVSWGWMGFGGGNDYSRDAGATYTCADLGGTSVTTQAGLSTTTPALTLYNPAGSTKNLVLLETGIDVTAAPAAATGFMLAFSTPQAGPTSTTPATVTTDLIGKSTGTFVSAVGQCYRIATLPGTAPIAFRTLGGTTGAAAISGAVFTDKTDGKVVVPPGVTISIQSTAAAAVVAHFVWREDAI